MILRRLLLASLVLCCWSLIGCAVAPPCNIRREVQVAPARAEGRAALSWHFNSELVNAPSFANTECFDLSDGRHCDVRLGFAVPDVNDVCGWAKVGVEVFHVAGGEHER